LRDQLLGTIERVSRGMGGAEADGDSWYSSISADGRFVAFDSFAWNLVPVDLNLAEDVFVLDRQSGVTTRASVLARDPVITSDGRFLAFVGTGPLQDQIQVRDLQNGTAGIVSVNSVGGLADGPCWAPSISDDGRYVGFASSATNLVTGDTNGRDDIFLHDRGGPPPIAFCFGDGSAGACPCGNNGPPGTGCQNSSGTGGAVLTAVGLPSVSADTLVFTSTGELFSSSTILLQGSASIAPANFGDGLRCVGGSLKRLYAVAAFGGLATAPAPGDPPVSARSAVLGDVLTMGATRYYQAYYRDPAPLFCPSPAGNGWNVSSGLSLSWGP